MNTLKLGHTSKAHCFTSQIVSQMWVTSPVTNKKCRILSLRTQRGTSVCVKNGIYLIDIYILWMSTKIKRSLGKYYFGWFYWCHPYLYTPMVTLDHGQLGVSLAFPPPFFSYSPMGSTWLMHGIENLSVPGLCAMSQNILWSTTKVNEACARPPRYGASLGGPLGDTSKT